MKSQLANERLNLELQRQVEQIEIIEAYYFHGANAAFANPTAKQLLKRIGLSGSRNLTSVV